MSKYLRKFDNEAAYSAATIYTPSVSLIADTMEVKFDPYVPTGNTYTVTIEGLNDALGHTITITWGEEHETWPAGNGTYSYTTSSDSIEVTVSIPVSYFPPNPKTVTLTPSNPSHTFTYEYE